MRNLLAVYHKELLSYFRTPIAYFVVAVFLLGTGYFFLYNVFNQGSANLDTTLQSMGVLLVTLSPFISMRLFAAEYSGRTMELLTTLPLLPWQVVLGKFLGAVTIFLLMTLGSMINIVPLYLYGNPEMSTIFAGYLGFFLLGLACLAVGQFFSVLTQNQIVAALITVAVLLAFWFIGHVRAFMPPGAMQEIAGYLSFALHYGGFIQGLVRSEAIAFYLLVCAVALTLNANYLQWRR